MLDIDDIIRQSLRSATAIANVTDRSDWRIKSSISIMSDPDVRYERFLTKFACEFAGDKIHCGRRIKSPIVSAA